MITFVAYLSAEDSFAFWKKNFGPIEHKMSSEERAFYRRDYEYLHSHKNEMIEAHFSSISLFHPNSRRILLVEDERQKAVGNGNFEVIVEKPSTPHFPLAKFSAWRNFLLKNTLVPGPVLFLDWDILVQASLVQMFASSRDFYISFSNKEERGPNHFNVGVMGVGSAAKEKVAKLFHLLLFMIRSNTMPSLIEWWGDQAAMEALFHPYWKEIIEKGHIHMQREGLEVEFLNPDVYNCSMHQYRGNFYEKAKIVHFSGNVKEKMLPYWNTHKEQLTLSAREVLKEQHNR